MHQFIDVASFTVLRDDVAVIDAEVYVMTADDAGVGHLSENGQFALEEATCYLAVDVVGAYLLDCDGLPRVSVGALVDQAETALPDLLLQIEDIVLYFLEQLQTRVRTTLHPQSHGPAFINYRYNPNNLLHSFQI